jgi:hypothetical protein
MKNQNTMRHQEILDTMLQNETLLMDYFKKVNVPTDRLQKVEVFNGRNCKCSALTLRCKNEQEFNSHKSAFYFANQKGGDYFTYSNNNLTITIKDNWN